jgi:nicotinamide-nucleotide adenylyltransferase
MPLNSFDVAGLVGLRRRYLAIDPAGPPAVGVLSAPTPARGSIGVLPSSFNPPTAAHLALARAGEEALGLDAVVLSYGRVIVDKAASGLRPEDRLLALLAISEARPRYGVAIPSVGLYAEMAEAYEAAFPAARRVFLVGFDKAEQIFDPRYYRDRDASLSRLFRAARLAVAGRAGKGEEALRALLGRPENARFAGSVDPLPLDPSFAELSSTRIRQLAAEGRFPPGEIPEEVVPLLSECAVYTPPVAAPGGEVDRYALRGAILDAAMSAASPEGDLREIIAALSRGERASLRARVMRGEATWEELAALA